MKFNREYMINYIIYHKLNCIDILKKYKCIRNFDSIDSESSSNYEFISKINEINDISSSNNKKTYKNSLGDPVRKFIVNNTNNDINSTIKPCKDLCIDWTDGRIDNKLGRCYYVVESKNINDGRYIAKHRIDYNDTSIYKFNSADHKYLTDRDVQCEFDNSNVNLKRCSSNDMSDSNTKRPKETI